jgi:hypothetical protein
MPSLQKSVGRFHHNFTETDGLSYEKAVVNRKKMIDDILRIQEFRKRPQRRGITRNDSMVRYASMKTEKFFYTGITAPT